MIFAGSRYEDAAILSAVDGDGVPRPAIYQRRDFEAGGFEFEFYTLKSGDRFDILAYSYYGNAELWWVLARANPEIFYPDDLPPGQRIRIPYPRFVR